MGYPLLEFIKVRDPERQVIQSNSAFIKRTGFRGPVVSHDCYGDT